MFKSIRLVLHVTQLVTAIVVYQQILQPVLVVLLEGIFSLILVSHVQLIVKNVLVLASVLFVLQVLFLSVQDHYKQNYLNLRRIVLLVKALV
jgi:hypothetical protein